MDGIKWVDLPEQETGTLITEKSLKELGYVGHWYPGEDYVVNINGMWLLMAHQQLRVFDHTYVRNVKYIEQLTSLLDFYKK